MRLPQGLSGFFIAAFFAASLVSAWGEPGAATPTPYPTDSPTPATNTTVKSKGNPYTLGFQTTAIWQQLFPFRSPYQGKNSLTGLGDSEVSETSTLYAGLRISPNLDAYLNIERASGRGVGNALGLAGYTNGEVIRNPTIGTDPYFARYMLRYTVPLGKETEPVEGGENTIRGTRPTHRLVFTAGKLGTNDIFDANGYSNSARTQFENWALINAASYDYAADTRGYTQGAALEWINPDWAVRVGRFQMPIVANGQVLDNDLAHAFGDQIELELHPQLFGEPDHTIFRLLAFRNSANLGDYQEALDISALTGKPPNVAATDLSGRNKVGLGVNLEQPLADQGNTGLFARIGWNDGKTESFAYTECDATFSLGGQLSGVHWNRPDDRIGLAYVQNEISLTHREYLAAGGLGFVLGDGRLNYGHEQILESYYSFRIAKPLWFSVDGQFILNPGYNKDRGPAFVPSTRLHFEF